jgi:hypothetical protein
LKTAILANSFVLSLAPIFLSFGDNLYGSLLLNKSLADRVPTPMILLPVADLGRAALGGGRVSDLRNPVDALSA